MTELREGDFQYLRKLVREHSAIVLDHDKNSLAASRLATLARREGLGSLRDLFSMLRAAPFNGLHRTVVEAFTTNETSFFRDSHPFEALRKHVLPGLIEARRSRHALSIWSAACSSGQEPYSLAMLIRDHFPELGQWRVSILASDISSAMIDRARRGRYTQQEVRRGLDARHLGKYFRKQETGWEVESSIRSMVEFRNLNLSADWPAIPRKDIVFLRNVMIYFDLQTRKSILRKISRLLHPDGWLFLGAAETTYNIDDSFERVRVGDAVCYRLRKR